MVNAEDYSRVLTALTDMCEPLHDVFTTAGQQTRERLPEFSENSSFKWITTHATRAFAIHSLWGRRMGKWQLSGNAAQNGALWFADGEYRARVLHAGTDEVPPPGSNGARRAFYNNAPLPLPEPLFGPPNDKLLILWRIDQKTGEPAFRVVRPIGSWKYGGVAKLDLDFWLPLTAAGMADLHFEPNDEGLELPLPKEEDGNADGVGGLSG